MKAGIKFCGGCNPRYDRGSQTTGLRERLKEVQWVSGDDSQVCDFWLIICGCSRACVSTESLSAKQQIMVIKSRMDFSRAEEIIRKAAADEKKQNRKRKRLKVGMTASMKKQITKTDVEEFARLTGDYKKMHMDEAFAADQWFQKRVAHGMFSSSLLSSVMGMKLPGEGTILMEESSIFRKPVFFGDMLMAEITFAGYQEEKMFYIGEFTGICRNQKGEVVTEMKARQMMMKKLFEIGGSEDDKSGKI